MEGGFSANNYHGQPYAVEGSPPTETAPEIMLAEYHPKKRDGRKKFKETRHPVYRGIRQRNADKWVCEIREPNKKSRIWLGTFPTAEMAARAHDVAAIALRGLSACLNFADSAWRLPVPASGDTKDIQRAAAEAAEAFRPQRRVVAEESAFSSAVEEEGKMGYWMDEDLFAMPQIVADMYNGMMLPPPPSDNADAYVEYDVDLPLWSF